MSSNYIWTSSIRTEGWTNASPMAQPSRTTWPTYPITSWVLILASSRMLPFFSTLLVPRKKLLQVCTHQRLSLAKLSHPKDSKLPRPLGKRFMVTFSFCYVAVIPLRRQLIQSQIFTKPTVVIVHVWGSLYVDFGTLHRLWRQITR